jgi:hypothetical protein
VLQSESFAGPPGWVLCEHFVVPCVPPYRLDLTVAVLRRTSLNPVDVLDAHGSYLRAFSAPKGLRVCVAHQPPDTNTLHIALYLPDDERKAPNEELRVRIPQMLGTGVNCNVVGYFERSGTLFLTHKDITSNDWVNTFVDPMYQKCIFWADILATSVKNISPKRSK